MATQNHSWYPRGRQEQLDMIKKWISVFDEPFEGDKTKKKREAWEISDDMFRDLITAYGEAEAAHNAVILSGVREGPLHVEAQEKAEGMERQAREVKRRKLFSPPLTLANLYELLLNQPDRIRSRRPAPRHTLTARITNPDLHVIQLEMIPAITDEDLSNFTYNIRMGILSRDGTIPERSETAKYYMTKVPVYPEDLPGQFAGKRRKKTFYLTATDAGNIVYFSICYQNAKGETGPWSPLISAIIT